MDEDEKMMGGRKAWACTTSWSGRGADCVQMCRRAGPKVRRCAGLGCLHGSGSGASAGAGSGSGSSGSGGTWEAQAEAGGGGKYNTVSSPEKKKDCGKNNQAPPAQVGTTRKTTPALVDNVNVT